MNRLPLTVRIALNWAVIVALGVGLIALIAGGNL